MLHAGVAVNKAFPGRAPGPVGCLLYLLLQRFLVTGLTAGALKD